MPERPYRLRELHDHLARSGGPCPERAVLDQASAPGQPSQALCGRCGRVTARRDPDGRPWCGGTHPAGGDPHRCPGCGWPVDPAAQAGGHTTHPTCDQTTAGDTGGE